MKKSNMCTPPQSVCKSSFDPAKSSNDSTYSSVLAKSSPYGRGFSGPMGLDCGVSISCMWFFIYMTRELGGNSLHSIENNLRLRCNEARVGFGMV